MDEEIKQLKSVLRSLVVSSPTQVDVRTLCRDYRNLVGTKIPFQKYEYKDPVAFLRDKFSDCFLFQGPSANPELTLIVPDALKHIDKFVQKQKTSTTVKFKGKRRSVPESIIQPTQSDLIVKSFNYIQPTKENKPSYQRENKEIKNQPQPKPIKDLQRINENKSEVTITNGTCSQSALQNFLKKRTAPYNSQYSISDKSSNEKESFKEDDDSGRQTSSSSSSSKRTQLEELKREIRDIIISHPEGVWCADLLRLYRERYGRELSFPRLGYTSVLSVACALADVSVSRQAAGDWLLSDARAAPPAPPAPPHPPRPQRAPAPAHPHPHPHPPDPDDALPGIAFEADVFPEDCMHFLESIPSPSLEDVGPGTMLEVAVAEVYSPSHFWLLRLGERYNIAMEDTMDEMNEYYTNGEGKDRTLALGAVRVGHYCASRYDGDWHRSLIVKIIDSDTVKVRHVDYGTVDRCPAGELRALRRRWAALAAQALRARLAAVRPPAAGRRWPRPAAHHFLRLVRDKRLVANVVAVDASDGALEVLLIDTATRDDRSLGDDLVRAGHADARSDSALGTSECYLYPRFEALENGDTPNFAEIHAYLRDGIALEFVDDYRRHVPPCLPVAPQPEPSPPPPPPLPPPPKPCARLVPHCATPPPAQPPRPPPAYQRPVPTPGHVPTYQLSEHVPAYQPTGQMPAFGGQLLAYGVQTPAFGVQTPAPSQQHAAGAVALPAAECEVFALLSRVSPAAAHQYMVQALSRAMVARSTLNPHAVEFRMVAAETQTDDSPALTVRPPPGFERD